MAVFIYILIVYFKIILIFNLSITSNKARVKVEKKKKILYSFLLKNKKIKCIF
jgi:hypothetical protein